jgi:hypothetical protein
LRAESLRPNTTRLAPSFANFHSNIFLLGPLLFKNYRRSQVESVGEELMLRIFRCHKGINDKFYILFKQIAVGRLQLGDSGLEQPML